MGIFDSLFNSTPKKPSFPPLSLYNTLGKEKQEFSLAPTAQQVRMYNCGPTVYGRQHIGNLSAAVFANTIRRVLEMNGYSVKQVINITDFGHLSSDADEGEDKMAKGLKKEGKKFTMENMHELATKYMELYFEDIRMLDIDTEKVIFPRASDYVPAMIAMIKTLEEKSYAYATSDGVYFDTARFQGYGALGGIDTANLKEGARVAANPEKHNPTDFALWKFSAGHGGKNLGWDSPWGKGFPGWHLECSAMINSILGKQIDIHTGGIEHIATHHNNEIAQSEAVTGKKPLSRFWMHRAHIQMGNAKIAKSSGNVAYLSDVIEKGIHPLALRYWFLTSHYRQTSNFTWEAVEAAQTAFLRLHEKMNDVRAQQDIPVLERFRTAFIERLNDDLDTPGAIALLWETIKDDSIAPEQLKAIFLFADEALGIGFKIPDERLNAMLNSGETETRLDDLPNEIKVLLEKRGDARAEKDFKKADKLREELEEKGYTVKDSPGGPQVFAKP